MNNLDIAIKELKDNVNTIVFSSNGKVVYTSFERGAKPLLDFIRTKNTYGEKKLYIADKVIGKATALLAVYLRAKELYAGVITEEAVRILLDNKVKVCYDKKVEFIQNRDKTGLCPLEKLSKDTENPIEMLSRLNNFYYGNNN